MARHELAPGPGTVADVFSRDLPPVLVLDPGDTLVVRSLDCSGQLARPDAAGAPPELLLPASRGHCLTGPVHVRGAAVGSAVSVHLRSVRPDSWGWTAAAGRDTPWNRRLGVADLPRRTVVWDLDPDALLGTSDLGFRVGLRPFLGVVGLAPAEPGEHSTVPPGRQGGNIDCRELVAGSTLHLPVAVAGGLLSVGDGHAAQGDGEVSGTAIECGMTSELVIDVDPDPVLRTPWATTPAGLVTFGFDVDLNEAAAAAMEAMLLLLEHRLRLDRPDVLALASVVVDLKVTQVANQVWGVHALLPEGALTPAATRTA